MTTAASGTSSCAGTVANGTPIDTSSTGTKTFVVNTADAAGNSSTCDRDLHRAADADGRRACEGLDWAQEQRRCRLRVDLRAQMLVNGVVAAIGELPNVSAGGGGFRTKPSCSQSAMSLPGGPVEVPPSAVVSLRVEARRTCSGGRAQRWHRARVV